METRRRFLQASTAAVFTKTALGASDRINIAVIGTGGRMSLLGAAFFKQPDCGIAAAVDVSKKRVDEFASKAGGEVATYGDYRRVLDRKDIDAVVIATPDHWHSPMTVEACAAGKDVYVEKPVSNTIPAAVKMWEAARKYNRVVQVGTQQRSWPHFQECAKKIRDGLLGNVTYVLVEHGGGGGGTGARRLPEVPQAVPEGVDWEMWQGPAKRHPFSSTRIGNWRSFYDYGGGSVTDWGVHWMDIVHMAMAHDVQGPQLANAVAKYTNVDDPDLERVPNAHIITWEYDTFLTSFSEVITPRVEAIRGGPGFFGTRGYLLVNRSGYIIRPPGNQSFVHPPIPVAPLPGDRTVARPNATTPRRPAEPSVEPQEFVLQDSVAAERAAEVAHVRNWLDCIKSRQKPVADIEIGFHSTLPCLLGLLAIRAKRSFAWDPNTKTAKAL